MQRVVIILPAREAARRRLPRHEHVVKAVPPGSGSAPIPLLGDAVVGAQCLNESIGREGTNHSGAALAFVLEEAASLLGG